MNRYCIGIDLGTTNCALAYVDLLDAPNSDDSSEGASKLESHVLALTQQRIDGSEISSETMPSVVFLPPASAAADRDGGAVPVDLQPVVGIAAREQEAFLPGRVIHSAKSWLTHSGVDRYGKLLPWGSDEVPPANRLSPVETSRLLLSHLRKCWDTTIGAYQEEYRLENQPVTITVPASFDEAAQRLTLDAARAAGFGSDVRLIEEPQAAFYRWIEQQGGRPFGKDSPEESLASERIVLVCDIGGGTTDLSLFRIRPDQQSTWRAGWGGGVERLAVSDHLLLGGDNLDLALAHHLEQKLTGGETRLTPTQWSFLLARSRELKERVLAGGAADDVGAPRRSDGTASDQLHLSIPGTGAGLFGGTLSVAVGSSEVRELILEGFFPPCERDAVPERHRSGLLELGLPYEPDSRVTVHLASFLGAAVPAGESVAAILWNGGTLAASAIRERILSVVTAWQDGVQPEELLSPEMDLAVARGAAYATALRLSHRRLIRAASARSIYVALDRGASEESRQYLCILPHGTEPEEHLKVEGRRFGALVNRPVQFRLFSSPARSGDRLGEVITVAPGVLHPLPALQTELRVSRELEQRLPGGTCEVQLEVWLSELGLLRVRCLPADGTAVSPMPDESGAGRVSWDLDFDLRRLPGAGGGDGALGSSGVESDHERMGRALAAIGKYYGKRKESGEKLNAKRLTGELEEILGLEREEWSLPLLRALWPPLREGMTRRGRSLSHEVAWLALAGYVLRPGFGADLDPWRIRELWRCYELGLSFPKETSAMVQWWILWRRVAGGLSREQQQSLARKALPLLREKRSDTPEIVRLLASLSRIDLSARESLGGILLDRLGSRTPTAPEHLLWALGRLGSRVPWSASGSGGIDTVLPPEIVTKWWSRIREWEWRRPELQLLPAAVAQIYRRTGDRTRDVENELRRDVSLALDRIGANRDFKRMVQELVPVAAEDRAALFGERLPEGLRLLSEEE